MNYLKFIITFILCLVTLFSCGAKKDDDGNDYIYNKISYAILNTSNDAGKSSSVVANETADKTSSDTISSSNSPSNKPSPPLADILFKNVWVPDNDGWVSWSSTIAGVTSQIGFRMITYNGDTLTKDFIETKQYRDVINWFGTKTFSDWDTCNSIVEYGIYSNYNPYVKIPTYNAKWASDTTLLISDTSEICNPVPTKDDLVGILQLELSRTISSHELFKNVSVTRSLIINISYTYADNKAVPNDTFTAVGKESWSNGQEWTITLSNYRWDKTKDCAKENSRLDYHGNYGWSAYLVSNGDSTSSGKIYYNSVEQYDISSRDRKYITISDSSGNVLNTITVE